MRQLHCPNCRTKVLFEDQRCLNCETSIAFEPRHSTMQKSDLAMPCGNRTLIGCNWSTEQGHAFCQSCRLTHVIPNLGSDRNVMLWKRVETAKRRLVHDLSRMKLPLAILDGPQISFDILSHETAGHPIMTGH